MITIFNFIYRFSRFAKSRINKLLTNKLTFLLLKINKVTIANHFVSNGMPKLFIHHTATIKIGGFFSMNNTVLSNPIGRNYKC